jgi:hypothetical protein
VGLAKSNVLTESGLPSVIAGVDALWFLGCRGGGDSNEDAIGNLLVVAPLRNGHRRDPGELLRDGELRPNHKIEPEMPI